MKPEQSDPNMETQLRPKIWPFWWDTRPETISQVGLRTLKARQYTRDP